MCAWGLTCTEKEDEEAEEDFIFHNTCTLQTKYIYTYVTTTCQKSLSDPSWPPIVANGYDITNNGEDKTTTEHRDNHEKASSLHSP